MMRRPYSLRAPVLAVGCGGRRGSIGGLVKGELLFDGAWYIDVLRA